LVSYLCRGCYRPDAQPTVKDIKSTDDSYRKLPSGFHPIFIYQLAAKEYCDLLWWLSNVLVGWWLFGQITKSTINQVTTYATTSKFVFHFRPVVAVLNVLNYCIVRCEKVASILQQIQHTASRFSAAALLAMM